MRFSEVEFGDEMPAFAPDLSAETVKRFVAAAGMNFPRFWDDEAARKEGLPGAIVPGIMSQGILAALVHRWAPDAKILHLDTTFRAPVLVNAKASCRGVVTNLDPDARVVEIDLTLANEAGETRVVSTARVELP
jgi:acyl dehydratase